MKKSIQMIIQILFLILFAVLIVSGKVQLWMGIFIIGVLLSLFLGRLYCGWVCPINTLMKSVTWLKGKLSIKSFTLPKLFTKPWIRYLMLALFIAVFAFTMVTGKKLPVLPALLIIGVGITIFFPEVFWHRYLCPYGTIFSITSSGSRRAMKIDDDLCVQCGACKRICPAGSIKSSDRHTIIKGDCIVCLECRDICKSKAIKYRKL